MKLTFDHFLCFLTSPVLANLLVQYQITLNCNASSPEYTGCLRGMKCENGVTCTKPTLRIHADSLYSLQPEIIRPRQDAPPQPAESTEPKIVPPAPAAAGTGGPVTTDGTCGASNGNTVCGNWERGSCCSVFGVSCLSLMYFSKEC